MQAPGANGGALLFANFRGCFPHLSPHRDLDRAPHCLKANRNAAKWSGAWRLDSQPKRVETIEHVAAPNPNRQKAARESLSRLFVHPASVFVVHYACESFDQGQGYASPRVTAIALRNLGSGATTSYSIHSEVELARRRNNDVAGLDVMELAMLARFYDFLARNPAATYLHWNMRDEKFGFAAIGHRYALLGGEPVAVHDSQKLDLSRLFVELFGSDYVAKPYIETLAGLNGLSTTSFLSGPEEARAFAQGQYYNVLQSVLCKVTLIADVAQLAADRALKTEATWWTLNGGQLREAYEMFWRNPVRAISSLVFGVGSAAFLLVVKLLS